MASGYRISREPQFDVEGTLKISTDKFPLEVLQKMMANPGFIPTLHVEIRKMYLTDGLSTTVDSGGSYVELAFGSNDIKIGQD